jgi:hypothetical protein
MLLTERYCFVESQTQHLLQNDIQLLHFPPHDGMFFLHAAHNVVTPSPEEIDVYYLVHIVSPLYRVPDRRSKPFPLGFGWLVETAEPLLFNFFSLC